MDVPAEKPPVPDKLDADEQAYVLGVDTVEQMRAESEWRQAIEDDAALDDIEINGPKAGEYVAVVFECPF